MGRFNSQGYDIVMELSEEEVDRQAKSSPLSPPDPQPVELPGAVSATLNLFGRQVLAIIRFRTINVWFDYGPYRPGEHPELVNRIVLNLPLKTGMPGEDRAALVHRRADGTDEKTIIPLLGSITIEARMEVQDIGLNKKDVF